MSVCAEAYEKIQRDERQKISASHLCGSLPPLKLGRWGSLSGVITNDIGGIGSIEVVRTIARFVKYEGIS
jgi:hypothetical protein